MDILVSISTRADYTFLWMWFTSPLMLICAAISLYCTYLLWQFPEFKVSPDKAQRSRHKEASNAAAMLAMWLMMWFTSGPMAAFCATVPVEAFTIHLALVLSLLSKVLAMYRHASGYRTRVRAL